MKIKEAIPIIWMYKWADYMCIPRKDAQKALNELIKLSKTDLEEDVCEGYILAKYSDLELLKEKPLMKLLRMSNKKDKGKKVKIKGS